MTVDPQKYFSYHRGHFPLNVHRTKAMNVQSIIKVIWKEPVVVYGCETWSHTLRKESRLRVFENRVLRGEFGPKRDGVTGDWRKIHNKELNGTYSSPNFVRVIKSRIMRWPGHVARMGETRGAYKVLVENPEGKKPLGRPTDGRITLRWVFRDGDMGHGLD